MDTIDTDNALNLIRGKTRVALARKLGITRQAIGLWKKIPAERVVEIEEVTGIPREQLRPDLYRDGMSAAQPQSEAA